MSSLVPMTSLLTSEPDIQALLSVDGETGSLDDNFNGSIDPPELQYLTRQACNYATDRVLYYCGTLYDYNDLTFSWLVNDWATIIACRWLRARRGNPIPASLQALYDEAIKMMTEVRAGIGMLPGIGYRNNQMPGFSNVSKDDRYWLRKIRVERPLSDNQSVPLGYVRKVDRVADVIIE